VSYEGSGTTNRSFLSADERGSIISLTDSAGGLIGINRYDEFGNPQSTNIGAFGYTGQTWLPSIKLWYYKARMYGPEPGRFWQTDPAGFVDGPNLHAYVLNDPVNLIDPTGLWLQCIPTAIWTVEPDGKVSVVRGCSWIDNNLPLNSTPNQWTHWNCGSRLLCKNPEPDLVDWECKGILCKDPAERPKPTKKEPTCDSKCQAEIAARNAAKAQMECALEVFVNPPPTLRGAVELAKGAQSTTLGKAEGYGTGLVYMNLFDFGYALGSGKCSKGN
jgi:RHS repeat-associated protein